MNKKEVPNFNASPENITDLDPRNKGFILTSFIRRGTRLNDSREKAYFGEASKFLLNIPRSIYETSVDERFIFDIKNEFPNFDKVIIEIGSGQGEAIVHHATNNPSVLHIAVEVYKPGVASTLSKILSQNLKNVRVVEANAPEFLACLPEESITEIHVNFPDPWHKKRHNKRRLVNLKFTAQTARVIKTKGVIRLATDWENYAEQIKNVYDTSTNFVNLSSGYSPRYEGRIVALFENKAHNAGRNIFDLTYQKI